MTIKQKLAIKINDDLGYNITSDDIVRLYPGYHQRGGGAWVWAINSFHIGSIYPMSVLVKAKKLQITPSGNIYPD